jgi:hypothetical protein
MKHGKVRSGLWAGYVTLLTAIGGFIRVTRAEVPISFALDYQVSPGAECPDRVDVEATVQREVGRPIFASTAEQQAILTIARLDAELVARIAFTSAASGGPAYRTVSAPLQDCRDLVRIFALLVALRAQGVEPDPEPEVEPKENRPRRPRNEAQAVTEESKPVVEPSPVAPTVVKPDVVEPGAIKENVARNPPRFALTLGPGLRTGFAPQGSPTLRLGMSAGTSAAFRIHAEMEGIWGGQHTVSPQGAYTLSGAALVASACWSPRPQATVAPSLCPVLTVTFIQVAGEGLDVSRTDRAFGMTGGLDARFRMALSDRFYLEAVLGGAFNPHPHVVRVSGDKAWESQQFLFNSALLLGYRVGVGSAPRAPVADLSTTTVPSKQ